MNRTFRNQVIALAGLSQAACLVKQIAHRGQPDRQDMEVIVASTLKIDASDVLDVYGGLEGLRTGLESLVKQLSQPTQVDRELVRYASTLIFLEKQAMQRSDLRNAITVAVRRAGVCAETAGNVLDDSVIEALAEGYQRTLSTLKPKVLVAGEQRYLTNDHNAAQIRALLLAGLRSVVLWRQCGGVRWRLLFNRSRMRAEAEALLKSLAAGG